MNSKHKKVFITLLLVFSIVVLVLPIIVSANNVLTKILEDNFLYEGIQLYIVPFEAKMMGVVLVFLGYGFAFSPSNSLILVDNVSMGITWNCLGWQSFLLLLMTLLVGFKGKYTNLSVLESLAIGILGTFWLNILRMLFTILLAVHAPPVFRVVFHDYLAAITTLVWLFVFWWFSYSFILVEKRLQCTKITKE